MALRIYQDQFEMAQPGCNSQKAFKSIDLKASKLGGEPYGTKLEPIYKESGLDCNLNQAECRRSPMA
jgi:hypothetical protein